MKLSLVFSRSSKGALFAVALPVAFAAALTAGCHSSSSGGASTPPGVYCRAQIASETICYGYTNLTDPEKQAVTEACTESLHGTIGGSCPSGEVGCCSTNTAGYQTTECYYSGTASALSEGCSASGGKWSTGGSPGSSPSTDGGATSAEGGSTNPTGPTGPTGPGGTCAAGQVECPKGCVDEQSDVENCGSCGYACPSYPGGQPSCQAGMCVSCGSGQALCNDTCVDTSSDPNNCGSCGDYCQSPNGGQGLCSNGTCVAQCPSGTTSCNDNTVCANLSNDINNCGSCGHVCPSYEEEGEPAPTCQNGTCQQSCSAGEALCNGTCIGVTSDINNCGACGNVCAGNTNECTNGTCQCQVPVYDNQMNLLACCTSNECYINNQCTTVGCLP